MAACPAGSLPASTWLPAFQLLGGLGEEPPPPPLSLVQAAGLLAVQQPSLFDWSLATDSTVMQQP